MSKSSKTKCKKINSRYVVTFVAAFLLILLYFMVFGFSAQDAEQSGSLSHMISEKCVEWINALSGKHWTDAVRQDLANYFEHPIRKLAHFSEYAIMGILVYTLWRPWLTNNKRLHRLVVLWVFLSAAGDEFHQYFVPGRYASFADVCLDTCGGIFGIILCVWAQKLFSANKRRAFCKDASS